VTRDSLTYFSERGHLLACSGYTGFNGLPDEPLLTVEIASKWYQLYLIRPDGSVHGLDFGRLEQPAFMLGISAYCDHVPNPQAVRRLAEVNSWTLDDLAEELIVGRWQLEVVE
jgi:hypothetical protein